MSLAMNGSTSPAPHELVPRSPGAALVPTLLGGSATRIPIGGRIRAGIKVLTRHAESVPEAGAIYARGVAAGKSFDAIEREITQRCQNLKSPLTPKNVPYFTVRGDDFPNPELARQIMEMYGEDRGEGVKRLYRFPVIFPADAWQSVMPHELVTWTASERRYWSEYSADGQTRYCKMHQAVPVDRAGQRTVRLFGGRKLVLRPENNGLCEPEACPEYQAKKCNLSGRFIFFIPGIKSISAFELPTNSFYAMQAAIEKFQTIGFMRGGRISGFLDGQRTPFYITKRLVEVSRIDDEGKARRVGQWLIEFEAPVDVTALLRPDDGLEAIESRAEEAAAVLEGRVATTDRAAAADVIEVTGSVQEAASPGGGSNAARAPVAETHDHGGETHDHVAARGAVHGQRPTTASQSHAASQGVGGKGDVAAILDAAAALGVPGERYEAYAEKRWGKGWRLAAGGRKRAMEELQAFAGNATGFQEKVVGELEVFS